MKRCAFTVPGRPSRWQRPGQGVHPVTGRPMRFTDKAAQAGKDNIAKLARHAWVGPPVLGPVVLRVVAVFKVPTGWNKALRLDASNVMHIADPDLDQLVKQVQDALVGIAYLDDNQVCGYPNSAKRYGSPERTEITIEVIDQPEALKTPPQREREAEVASKGWDQFLYERAAKRSQSKTRKSRR